MIVVGCLPNLIPRPSHLSLRTKFFRILFAVRFWLEFLVENNLCEMWKMKVRGELCSWENMVLRHSDSKIALGILTYVPNGCGFSNFPSRGNFSICQCYRLTSLVAAPDLLASCLEIFISQLLLQSSKS